MGPDGTGPDPTSDSVSVVGADEQDALPVDVERWTTLASAVLRAVHVAGELTLTFVDAEEMAALNAEYMGQVGPTDVLSFPLDADADPDPDIAASAGAADVPVLLGDVVICPEVAASAAADHAGTVDDELALLVVHGILHVLGHDHLDPAETQVMHDRERELLEALHWRGPAPAGFSHEHRDDGATPSSPDR